LYWIETRPLDGARSVVVRCDSVGGAGNGNGNGNGDKGEETLRDGTLLHEVTPPDADVRSKVHEYGGGAYCVIGGRASRIAYVNLEDQRVVVVSPESGSIVPISPVPPAGERWHHGDLCPTNDGRWVLAVRERHRKAALDRDVVAYRVASDGDSDGDGDGDGECKVSVLCSGRQFFAAPRPAPLGRFLAWLSWNHPDMPWDAAELWLCVLEEHETSLVTSGAQLVAGGRHGEPDAEGVSAGQPLWCEDDRLVFVSDVTGWWQPWSCMVRLLDASSGAGSAVAVGPLEQMLDDTAEFHGADWVLGRRTAVELSSGRVAFRRRSEGADTVVIAGASRGDLSILEQPCVSIGDLCEHRGGVAWLGSTADTGTAAWWVRSTEEDVGSPVPEPIGPRPPRLIDPELVSVGEPFSASGSAGVVHGLYYPPARGSRSPIESAPPLVVICHGGPTTGVEAGFDPFVQLFTSHGMAVAAIDYSGSTGYGRHYRQRLYGHWGILDPDDCAAAARQLAADGRADARRMAVRGASAGGFTALCALARSSIFACGVSWYGVTDLAALAASTHDFESHYTQHLVGVESSTSDALAARSPVHLVTAIDVPVLVIQGLDDPIVPPAQAQALVEALRDRGLRCDYLPFEGEGHGLRQMDHISEALNAELALYEDILWQR